MRNKIQNIDDLRSEILRLKLQRFQQEAILQEDVKHVLDKFRGPALMFNKITAWFGNGKGDNPKTPQDENDWVTNTFRLGLPVVLNKLIFPRSGFIVKSLVALLSQKAASNVNKDILTDWIDKGANWIRHFKNNKPPKEKHSDYGIPPDSETY